MYQTCFNRTCLSKYKILNQNNMHNLTKTIAHLVKYLSSIVSLYLH